MVTRSQTKSQESKKLGVVIKKKNSLKSAEPKRTAAAPSKPSRVDLNVSGTIFTVDTATIMQYPDTMLGAMLSKRWTTGNKSDEEIFLDRDPVIFRYILSFYRNATLFIPHTITKGEMLAEIEYFSLPLQEKDIQYDTSSIARMKDTILGFDNRYVDNLKKTARERAIVACAYELAAFSIERLRSSPRSKSFRFLYDEIPTNSFAKVMYYELRSEALFRKTIQNIVEKAGYTFDRGIDYLKLK